MRACLGRFGPELYDRTTASLSLNFRMLKAEAIEALLYGCETWTLRAEHFAKLRTAHHLVSPVASHWLPAPTSYQPRHPLVREGPKEERCESIETAIRKPRLFFAGGVARQRKERLPSRVMFGTMADGENPRPGGQFKTWA